MEQIKVTDELLNNVLPKVCDELVHEWEQSAKEKHTFSKEFNRNMKKIIWRHKNKQLLKILRYIGTIAATIIIFFNVFFFGDTLFVRANLDVLFRRMEIILENSSMYVYDEDSAMYIYTLYEPGFVPKGYTEASRTVEEGRVIIKYVDKENNYIVWNQMIVKDGTLLGADAEYDDVVVKEYAGENATIHIYENGYKGLYYEMGSCIFKIAATDISENDIFRMIERMQEIEKK